MGGAPGRTNDLPGPEGREPASEGLVGTTPGWVRRPHPTACRGAAGKESRGSGSRGGRPGGAQVGAGWARGAQGASGSGPPAVEMREARGLEGRHPGGSPGLLPSSFLWGPQMASCLGQPRAVLTRQSSGAESRGAGSPQSGHTPTQSSAPAAVPRDAGVLVQEPRSSSPDLPRWRGDSVVVAVEVEHGAGETRPCAFWGEKPACSPNPCSVVAPQHPTAPGSAPSELSGMRGFPWRPSRRRGPIVSLDELSVAPAPRG